MKYLLLLLTGSALCLLTGCETAGISSREHAGVDYPNYVLSLAATSSNTPPQKPVLPVRLAVAQIGESAPPRAMLDALSAQPDLITGVVGLPLPGGRDNFQAYEKKEAGSDYAERVKVLCRLAQAQGANYVFLFGGNLDSWTEGNMLRFLDITIIGGMVFPATKITMEGKGAGVLIEAATEQAVFLINVDDQRSKYSPDFFSTDKTTMMQVQARDALVQKLQASLVARLRNQTRP